MCIFWVKVSELSGYRIPGEIFIGERASRLLLPQVEEATSSHMPRPVNALMLDQMDPMHWCWIKCVTFHLDWRRQFGVRPLDHCKRIVRVDIGKHTKIKANNFVSFSSPLCRVMDGSSLGSSLQASSSGQVSGMLINSHTGSKLRNIFRVHSWHFSSSSRKERFGFFSQYTFLVWVLSWKCQGYSSIKLVTFPPFKTNLCKETQIFWQINRTKMFESWEVDQKIPDRCVERRWKRSYYVRACGASKMSPRVPILFE